jgi:hypothetical protein
MLWAGRHRPPGTTPNRRKRRLKRLIRPPVLYVDHIERRGVDLFEATCGRDLEGIVAKLGWVVFVSNLLTNADLLASFCVNARGILD